MAVFSHIWTEYEKLLCWTIHFEQANTGKYGPKNLQIWDIFKYWIRKKKLHR